MNADAATSFARRMVDLEASASGDIPAALERLARRHGFSRWTLDRLRKGRTKTVEVSLFARLRTAYLSECERQIGKLEQELAMERRIYGEDEALAAAESTLEGFQASLAKAKAGRPRVSRD